MTAKAYRRTILLTVLALIAIAMVAIFAIIAVASDCRGEGCGWLLLGALMWFNYLVGPILLLVVLAGFLILSMYRFRDAGLPPILALLPTLLIPGVVRTSTFVLADPAMLTRYPSVLLNLVSAACALICLFCLLFRRTVSLEATTAGQKAVGRYLPVAIILCALLTLPGFIHNLYLTFSLFLMFTGRSLLDAATHIVFNYSWLFYLDLVLQAGITMAVVMRMRDRDDILGPRSAMVPLGS